VTLAPTLAVPVALGAAVPTSLGSVTVKVPPGNSQQPASTLTFQVPVAAPVRSTVAVSVRLSAETESVVAVRVLPL
jgi:hypothetical protein